MITLQINDKLENPITNNEAQIQFRSIHVITDALHHVGKPEQAKGLDVLLRCAAFSKGFCFHQVSRQAGWLEAHAQGNVYFASSTKTLAMEQEKAAVYTVQEGEDSAKIHRSNIKQGQGYTDKMTGVNVLQDTTGEFTTDAMWLCPVACVRMCMAWHVL